MSASLSDSGRITAIAVKMLLKRGVNTIPGSGDNLRDAGLTSLDMVNLMLAIEAEFDIEIPQSAMTPDNFDTVSAIEALVSVTAKAA
jgi:acyl carrier protein